MRVKITFFIVILFFCVSIFAQPKFIDVLSVNDVIKNMQQKYNEIETFESEFTIINKTEGTTKKSRGIIKFKKPSLFIMRFSRPNDQIIYYNGDTLKIYIPSLKVLGEQRLSVQDQSTLFINTKTTFYQLVKNYNFSFRKSNKPEIVQEQDVYILVLTPKEAMVGFKEMKLWVNIAWVIIKAEGRTYTGDIISISFNKFGTNEDIDDGEFEIKLPVNVQTIYNPLLTIEQEE